jgi:hypothetical protein
MKRYYFDLRDQDGLAVDDEGLELHSMECVQKEASKSMTDAIREMSRWPLKTGETSIEVRDENGQVMFIRFAIEIEIGRKN